MKTVNVDSDTQIKIAVCRPSIRNAMRRAGLSGNRKMSLALVAPEDAVLQDYLDALKVELGAARLLNDFKLALFATASRKDEWAWEEIDTALETTKGVIVIIPSGVIIPASTAVALDRTISIGPLRPTHLVTAVRTVFDVTASTEQARRLLGFPRELMLRALRNGRPIETIIERLDEACVVQTKPVRELAITEMAGYGPAKDWAAELAIDIKDWAAGLIGWSDVDRGLLLSGPPGSGKTIFAAAVARSCGMSVVKASAAQWQAEGHLGDYLKAMRKSFRQAAEKAPCILFIDEFDSVGDRARAKGDNANYMIQVVNGVLEMMDGANAREGVVVIASTNQPDRIDAALRRPGRLDRHIAVELPDRDSRKVILSQHIGAEFDPGDQTTIADRTAGFSGADLAQLARDSKRIARRQRRKVTTADVLSIVPPAIIATDDERWLSCLHEAGHAVIGSELGFGEIEFAVVRKTMAAKDGSSGHVLWKRRLGIHRTRQSYIDEIAMLLGGRAAEEVIASTMTDGTGGNIGSDLELATSLAAMMEVAFGMGQGLSYTHATTRENLDELLRTDPALRDRVEHILKCGMKRARELVRNSEASVLAVAHVLMEREFLKGADVRGIIEASKRKSREPFSPGD